MNSLSLSHHEKRKPVGCKMDNFRMDNTEGYNQEELDCMNDALELIWDKTENKSKSSRDYVMEQILSEDEYYINLMRGRRIK